MNTWQPRKALLHWTRGTPNPLSGCTQGPTRGTSNPPFRLPWDWHTSPIRMSYPDSMDSVSNKSHDRVSRAIIIHFTKSMLDGTFLGHFRRPATTCPAPPIERKDKDGSKSSLPQSLIAACRIMITLPPSKHHHDKPKGFPTIKGDKSPGTIKGPHTVKKGKHS